MAANVCVRVCARAHGRLSEHFPFLTTSCFDSSVSGCNNNVVIQSSVDLILELETLCEATQRSVKPPAHPRLAAVYTPLFATAAAAGKQSESLSFSDVSLSLVPSFRLPVFTLIRCV